MPRFSTFGRIALVSLHRQPFSLWFISAAVGCLCLGVQAQTTAPYSAGGSSQLQAATPQALQSSTQAVTIASMLQRMGGLPPKDSLATANVTVTAGRTSESGTMRILTRGTTQTLEEISIPSGMQRFVFSEGEGLRFSKDKTGGMSFEESLSAQSPLFILPLLSAQLSDSESIIEDLGIDNLNDKGKNHFRVSKTFASNKQLQHYSKFTTRDIWIDPLSGLATRIAYERRRASGAVPAIAVSVEYSDYRQIGGFLYPFSIRKFINGTLWADIRIQTVVFDTNIPSSDFSGK